MSDDQTHSGTAEGDEAVGNPERHPLRLPDDRFIPVRVMDLAEAIDADAVRFGDLAGRAVDLAEAIDHVVDQEVTALHGHLSRRYEAINPDRDTLAGEATTVADADAAEKRFIERLRYVFDKASYEQLNSAQIEVAIRSANSAGIRVRIRPDLIESLHLWVRGRGTIERRRRTWRRPIKGVMEELEVYRRLAVAVRIKGEDALRLKLYRDIPCADLEALLPHARVTMGLFDRLQVFGGGAGALGGLLFKLIPALLAGGIGALFGFAQAAAIAFGGLAFKSFMGWRRKMKDRDGRRTRHLYDRTLGANATVLHAVLAQIEQEEVKEALVACAVLRAAETGAAETDGTAIENEAALRDAAEVWVRERFGVSIRFDATDALETLDRLSLWRDGARWRLRSTADLLRQLDARWASREGESYHGAAMGRRQAAR